MKLDRTKDIAAMVGVALVLAALPLALLCLAAYVLTGFFVPLAGQ